MVRHPVRLWPAAVCRRGVRGADSPPAFTLIELLVVISIIALLIALLLPALGAAKATATTTQCSSGQRQVAMAALLYTQQYQGLFPPVIHNVADASLPGGYRGTTWLVNLCRHELLPDKAYQVDPGARILLCPASTVRLSGGWDPSRGQFAANRELWGYYNEQDIPGTTPGIRVDRIRNPAGRIMLLDGGIYHLRWWHPGLPALTFYYVPGSAANAGFAWGPEFAQDAIGGRHPGKTINIAYIDGHGQPLPAAVLTAKYNAGDHSMWPKRPSNVTDEN